MYFKFTESNEVECSGTASSKHRKNYNSHQSGLIGSSGIQKQNKTRKNVCVMIDDCNSNVFFYLFRFLIQVKSYKGFAMTVGHR